MPTPNLFWLGVCSNKLINKGENMGFDLYGEDQLEKVITFVQTFGIGDQFGVLYVKYVQIY